MHELRPKSSTVENASIDESIQHQEAEGDGFDEKGT
jgi:hypothetical protein